MKNRTPRTVNSVVFSSPAKLNLFLAITGRRPDGFHQLVSMVAPVEFGDTLTAETRDGGFTLACDDPALAIDETNLILRAARAFALESGWDKGAHFTLVKRIPMGAGLGGGSSNATATLLALNQLSGGALSQAQLTRIAAQLGSDCALFLHGKPVVMRGRGEQVEPLPAATAARLSGRRVLIFKPPFSINTAWAYGRMAAAAPESYLPEAEAERRLASWIAEETAPVETLLLNNMEAPAFGKFVALPVALERLAAEFGLAARMSGSGSACFVFLAEDAPVERISARIRELWGAESFVTETRLA